MEKNIFSERLSLALKERNLNQAELSKRTGFSSSQINHWVKGKYEAKQDKIYRISLVLDVNPAWLMGFDVPMELGGEKESIDIGERKIFPYRSIDLQELFQSGAEIRFSSYILTKKQVRQLRKVLYAVFSEDLPIIPPKDWDVM
ncbi:Helix-turn-helix [Pilibacter termitis]|uniref:Helix-turn-helix n=1 Tax=Pilibacter termitis TaxID=263852 RepID=A0A1T4LJJ1_9ENTE|nr:helix-turn-helix transcriptional regulator [Pilibacter termitis]SJZ54875.1 Helix-turn-helix [Pilibacter termitis]